MERKNLKRKCLAAVLAACALVLCLGLAACGGPDPAEDFVGTWELESGGGEDQQLAAEEVAMMKGAGLACTLTLEAEGTAVLDMFGETMEGSWEAKDVHEGTVTMEGDAVDALIDDAGKLTLERDDFVLVFLPSEYNDTE